MGLFNNLFGNRKSAKKRRIETRVCRFEEIESRELLSVNPVFAVPDGIDLGIVYHEEYAPGIEDSQGDTFTVTWNGGADGTTLDRIVINTDVDGDGLTAGDMFFNTQGRFMNGLHTYNGFSVVSDDGVKITGYTVQDGGQSLVIEFEGFTAGKQFVFSIDVDEYLEDGKIDSIVTGEDFAGSLFHAEFSSTDYENVVVGTEVRPAEFSFDYDVLPGLEGKLPPSEYYPENSDRGMTAGFTTTVFQTDPKPGSISGFVYEDDNNDGTMDEGERGIANVLLTLQRWNSETQQFDDVAETQTGADGYYEFRDIEGNARYRVVETQPEKYVSGKNTAGTLGGTASDADDWITTIDIGANRHGEFYNFGELARGSLSGYVYNDLNNDGIRDSGEAGIANVQLTLYVFRDGEYKKLAETTTNEQGRYEFVDLDPMQKYRIVETQPNGYISGKNTAGMIDGQVNGMASDADDWITAVNLPANRPGTEYNFGELDRELYAGSLSGYVYVDKNNNGTRDSGERGISDVFVHLWIRQSDGSYVKIASVQTQSDGSYCFTDLDPNHVYRITEDQPSEYDDGFDRAGSLGGIAINPGDEIHTIPVGLAEHGTEYDFGELEKPDEPPPPAEPGSLSGSVYVDANKNGVRDRGEKGIAGVTVTLWVYNAETRKYEVVASKTTGADGSYSFTDLDPNRYYRLTEQQPSEYDDGKEHVGSLGGNAVPSPGDDIYGIWVGEDKHGTDYDFGEHEKAVLEKPGTIGGYVYEDDDNDGVKDPGEKGIPGVTVALCVWDPVQNRFVTTNVTAVTDENGYYEFQRLPAGTYCVTEVRDSIDDKYCDGKDTAGTLGGTVSEDASRIYGIELGEDRHGRDYNFGELRRGSISGYVYEDANENGVKDSGEKGIANVTLTLWVWDETLKDYRKTNYTTTTDANGRYIFEGLCPTNKYRITEEQPEGYRDGAETVGTLGGRVFPTPADNIDDILMPVGGRGLNYNFGEIADPVDPPEPPEPPKVPMTNPPRDSFVPSGPVIGATGGYSPASHTHWSPDIQPRLNASIGGGGGIVADYSWHLSVLNGGYPRDGETGETALAANTDVGARMINVSWTPSDLDGGVWYVRDKFGSVRKRFVFGTPDAKPLVGDFNGDGISDIGIFYNGHWYIDINGNGVWDPEDIYCALGSSGDQPLVGDWDGDGKADIGIFGPQWEGDAEAIPRDPGLPGDLNELVLERPKNTPPGAGEVAVGVRALKHSQRGQARFDVIDHVFQYGGEGDVAVAGDFNGDGVTEIGVYRGGSWFIDFNGDGRWNDGDVEVRGEVVEGAVPVVGDWTGEGVDRIGIFVDGVWHLDTTGNFEYDTVVEFGKPGDVPFVGDFSGDGIAELGVYRPYSGEPLLTRSTQGAAPDATPGTFPSLMAEVGPRVASEYGAQSQTGEVDEAARELQDGSTLQGTLPEHLMNRQERTVPTPYTGLPLDE